MTIPEEYREFFVAIAGATGALIGLLFVAVTLFPENARKAATRTEYHARASAALLVFSNALVVSLAALVPGVSLGWWAVVTAAGLLTFNAATTRSVIVAVRRGLGNWSPMRVVLALTILAGFELYAGFSLIADEGDLQAIRTLDYVLIANLVIGIARAWQLMHMRNIGLFSSLFSLARGDQEEPEQAEK